MEEGLSRIEIEFATPVVLSEQQERQLHDLVQAIAKANEPEGMVHWLCGTGFKPLWSEADAAAFPDLPGGRSGSGAASGEPDFDHSTLHFATACREK